MKPSSSPGIGSVRFGSRSASTFGILIIPIPDATILVSSTTSRLFCHRMILLTSVEAIPSFVYFIVWRALPRSSVFVKIVVEDNRLPYDGFVCGREDLGCAPERKLNVLGGIR